MTSGKCVFDKIASWLGTLVLGLFLLCGTCTISMADDLKNCDESNLDDLTTCIRALESAALNETELAFVYFRIGVSYMRRDDRVRAIASFDESIRILPTAWSFLFRGNSHLLLLNFDRAIADYNEAIRLDKETWASAYAGRGLAYKATGDLARANDDFRSALSAPAEDAVSKSAQQTARENIEPFDIKLECQSVIGETLVVFVDSENKVVSVEYTNGMKEYLKDGLEVEWYHNPRRTYKQSVIITDDNISWRGGQLIGSIDRRTGAFVIDLSQGECTRLSKNRKF